MKRTRVLVADDSLTVRRRLCEVLAGDPEIELVGEAADGKQAVEACIALRPDVVTLDMAMPVMSGVAATEQLMAHCPTPILIVSSSLNRGELFSTYEALAAGAVDVLEKPRGDEPEGEWERLFVSTVKLVARIRVITHVRGLRKPALVAAPPAGPSRCDVVAIGASTGGPAAIVDVLRGIPAGFATPIVFVLHINEPFGQAFAEWLDRQTPHAVAVARDGDVLGAHRGVSMAPPGSHLVVDGGRIRLTRDPERHSCRPSIDVMFESLARSCGASTTAVLLTGMGRDGAAGLLAIKRAGGHTIAQDEATSIVFGMPREAIERDAATVVLPLPEIGPAIAAIESVKAKTPDKERRP